MSVEGAWRDGEGRHLYSSIEIQGFLLVCEADGTASGKLCECIFIRQETRFARKSVAE